MMEAGRVGLTDREREWLALTISDVFTPLGMDFDAERGARLLEARLAVLLAARGERGYHEGWAMRASGDPLDECTCGHYYSDHPCARACGCTDA